MAQTGLHGEKLRIWLAEPLETAAGGAPGAVVATGKQGIEVATGEGRLRITQLQPPGKRAMRAVDFLNAHDLDGVVFGG